MFTRRSLSIHAALFAALLPLTAQEAAAVEIKDPENTLIMTLKTGDVTIELLPDVAPKHVERIKTLAREGAYDGVAFHRVIPGFMAQTGDVEHGNTTKG
ncbi:MAG: peptidylprolyl isomerase, partial [Alphaproteobacteria bacterium HGW-Alphaproteobacteria-8]